MGGNALDTRPRSVALVALGPSYRSFVESKIHKKHSQHYDEVWVVNSGLECFKADKVWLMDDLRMMEHRYPAWAERIKRETTPIVTCRTYPEYASAVEYPLQDVIRCVQDDWFTNTVAYAIGYAILTKVEELFIFGADFMYPGSLTVEPGADCCAYLLGIATGRGVRWKLPQSTTLMDSHITQVVDGDKMQRPLYGYDYNPGDCRSKVERGVATEMEKILARKAPHSIKEMTDGAQHAVAPDGKGQPHRAVGDRPDPPVRRLGRAEPGPDHPAGRESVLPRWRRDRAGEAPIVGIRAVGSDDLAVSEGHRVDGSDGPIERAPLTFAHERTAGGAPGADRGDFYRL